MAWLGACGFLRRLPRGGQSPRPVDSGPVLTGLCLRARVHWPGVRGGSHFRERSAAIWRGGVTRLRRDCPARPAGKAVRTRKNGSPDPELRHLAWMVVDLLVTPSGFEPPTCPLGGGCSIQLSHGASLCLLRKKRPKRKSEMSPVPRNSPRCAMADGRERGGTSCGEEFRTVSACLCGTRAGDDLKSSTSEIFSHFKIRRGMAHNPCRVRRPVVPVPEARRQAASRP